MDGSQFGPWAVVLSQDDLACALAALAVTDRWPPVEATADLIVRFLERATERTGDETISIGWTPWWHFSPFVDDDSFDPRVWVKGWQTFAQSHRPRLECSGPRAFTTELVELFARPAVQASSVYLREELPEGEVRWNWPLRVGFLNDPASVELHASLCRLTQTGETHWRNDYIQLCRPGDTGGLGCHILLLPGDLRPALAALSSSPRVVRAACVLVLGSGPSPTGTETLLAAVRVQARAEGVALVSVPRARLAVAFGQFFPDSTGQLTNLWSAWFIELVRALSHNSPLDVALFDLWQRFGEGVPAPVLVASRRLVRESRVGERIERLAVQFQSPDLADLFLQIGHQTANRLNQEPAKLSMAEFGRRLTGRAKDLAFFHESDGGTAMLDLLTVLRKVRRARPPRWVQAYVHAEPSQSPRPARTGERTPLQTFLPNTTHTVVVFVGPREAGAIQPPLDAPPMREDGLPEDRGVRLTVAFVPSAADATAQVKTVFLPRNGRSTNCTFTIHVPEGLTAGQDRVEARIIVLYRNRVLQTSILGGPIGANGREADAGIKITPEVVVHDNLDSLNARSDFDAAIVLNHAGDDTPTATTMREGRAVKVRLTDSIGKAIDWFDDKMEEMADNAETFSKLTSKASVTLLRELAQQGSLLWSAFDELVGPDIDFTGDRFQIVTADPNTRLPVEFFYDRPAPRKDAKLCPGAARALRSGGPCPVCAKRAADDNSVVCPLAFWGLSKVLERHLHRKGDPLPPDDALSVAGPVAGRNVLYTLGPYLFAASHRVDAEQPGGIGRLRKALRQACGCSAPSIAKWDKWSQEVMRQASHLLFLVPHVIDDQVTTIEIGVGDALETALVAAAHVRSPADRTPPPIVVLLGCKTAKAKYMFSNVVAAFRRQRPAAVICTGAPIVGRHAVPVAEALLKTIRAAVASSEPMSLGDVMRDVRRAMVRAGLLMAFTVLAFGDLDWQIAGKPKPTAAAAPAAVTPGSTRRRQGRKGVALVTP